MPEIDLSAVGAVADSLFADHAPHGVSLAFLVQQSGEVVYERYGHTPDTAFGEGGPVTADSTLISWSMAKSMVHAAVGILVDEGRLQLDAPAAVAGWAGTPKEAITLQHLLNMQPGLAFIEDYVDDQVSNCIEMLYGSGAPDMAAYAAALPLEHEPGTFWNYSSGTTNIISRIVGDAVGGGRDGMEAFLRDRLFGPAGMHSAIPKFDDAGTFIGSSFVFATARDFARFGELYRNDGVAADGTRVLPVGWRDHARTFAAHDEEFGFDYGAQWWLWPDLAGSYACHGYEGQYILVVPDSELVIVHLGKCPASQRPIVNEALRKVVAAAG
jgi:CubicO group peptidase (beta-lactamase class C family)